MRCAQRDLMFSTIYKALLWLPSPSQLARVQDSAPSWMKGCGRALNTLPQVFTGIDSKTNDTKTFSELVMGRLFSLRFKSLSQRSRDDNSELHQI